MRSRRRHCLNRARFEHAATLTCEVMKACRPRVVTSRAVRRSGKDYKSHGVDRQAREVAGYLVVTIYNVSRNQVAKALSINRCTISRWCSKVEARRDNPDFDNLVTTIEDRIGGRA